MAAKGNCGFGAVAGQGKKPLARSARKQNAQRVFHVRMNLPRRVAFPELLQRETHKPFSGTAIYSEQNVADSALNGEEYHTQITPAAYPLYEARGRAKNSKAGTAFLLVPASSLVGSFPVIFASI